MEDSGATTGEEEEEPPFVLLPDGTRLPPDSFMGGYYGTNELEPEVCVDVLV